MGFPRSTLNNTAERLLFNANLSVMSTVLITGGTGLVGKALGQALLQKGYQVIILTRNPAGRPAEAGLSYAAWDVEKQTIASTAISDADHIIHLAGAGVAERRWTPQRKQEIISSRVQSSRLLIKGLQEIPNKVRTVVSASAIGWYGPDRERPGHSGFTEDEPAAPDFLGTTCKQWEESISPVTTLQKRLVLLRVGIVLSKKGGALKEFLRPLRFGIGAVLGSGKQVVSWIHINDIVSLFMAAIEKDKMTGVYNAVAPGPVTNKELVIRLAKSRKKFYIPFRVPSFILKLLLGEMSQEVLKSTTVNCDKILAAGFEFNYPSISSALSSMTE